MKKFVFVILMAIFVMGCGRITELEQRTAAQEEKILELQESVQSFATEMGVFRGKFATAPQASTADSPAESSENLGVLTEEEQYAFADVEEECLDEIEDAKRKGDNHVDPATCEKLARATVWIMRKVKAAKTKPAPESPQASMTQEVRCPGSDERIILQCPSANASIRFCKGDDCGPPADNVCKLK